MIITRDNYEIFFLDYAEGRLDESLLAQLFLFLQQNPDLKEELSLFEMVEVPLENIVFPDKEKLYRTDIHEQERFEANAVAWLEGDMTPGEAADFEKEAQKIPGMQSELELFGRTKLEADLTLVFEGKNKLYRQSRLGTVSRWWFSAAALFLTALAIWGLWPRNLSEVLKAPQVAETITQPDNITPPSGVTALIEPLPSGAEPGVEPKRTTGKPTVLSPGRRSELSVPENNGLHRRENTITEQIPVKYASIEIPEYKPDLAAVIPGNLSEIVNTEEDYTSLSERVINQLGINDFTFSKLLRSGLKVAGTLTNEKFSADTNPSGEIIALSLDTRILGVHIPIGKND
jgi:hypothetical protein